MVPSAAGEVFLVSFTFPGLSSNETADVGLRQADVNERLGTASWGKEMSLADLMPIVQALPRADKLRLMQLLVVELAREEGVPLVELGGSYPVWTPHHAYDAAAVLLRELQREGPTS